MDRQGVLFEGLFDKPVSVEFTGPAQSSDGGVVLLKAVDERLGLTRGMAEAVRDRRQSGKVVYAMVEMLRERIFGIACGYPDGNDAAKLSGDPLMRLVCRGSVAADQSLASQPTLSRMENAVKRADLVRMAYALTDTVIAEERRRRRGRRVRQIVIDMDPTEDPTYGDQQLTFFNAHYDNWCYLPMVTTMQFDGEAEQIFVAPVLRPGNAKGSLGAKGLLKRLLARLRAAFPGACILVRMDGAFATPEVLAFLEAEKLGYAINMPKNAVLQRLAAGLMRRVRAQVKVSGHTEKRYGQAMYQAGKWPHARRVAIKAEQVVLEGREPRDNPRFVIHNLRKSPKQVYGFYAARGDMENRIKELHDGLRFDRTSCTDFLANQLRILLAGAAYVLYQQLRRAAAGTACARAQVWTWRDRLIKISVVVRESVRRILLEGPQAYPWLPIWRRVAFRLGASP